MKDSKNMFIDKEWIEKNFIVRPRSPVWTAWLQSYISQSNNNIKATASLRIQKERSPALDKVSLRCL